MSRPAALLVAALVALATLPAAHAEIVTFNNLTGPHLLPVSSYAEGSFTVTPTIGTWVENHVSGNAVPAISCSAANSSVDITRTGGGTFTFNSVDLGNLGTGMPNFQIYGFLNNNWIYGYSTSLLATNAFTTVNSYDTNMVMDTLRITLQPNDSPSVAIDNINLGSVPEPSSLALLSASLIPLLRRRPRH